MPTWDVIHSSPLDVFLRNKGTQPWRIPVLVGCGAIKVISAGAELPLTKGAKTHVDTGDKVQIADPLSTACWKALYKEADTNSRDYAFVPGTSPFDLTMRKLIDARPETIRVKDPATNTLLSFIRVLDNPALTITPLVTNPIRKIIVASHANDEGQLKVVLEAGAAKFIEYEDLEAVLGRKSLFLKDELFRPRPTHDQNQPIPYQLLIRGCRIGTQPKFLEKLREALGGRIEVVAPKHFHAVLPHLKTPYGFIEYMAYSFAISSPTELKNKDAVVKALIKAKPEHEFIDGNLVPEKKWQEWVPENPQKTYEQKKYISIKSPVTKKNPLVPRTFRYKVAKWLTDAEPLAMDRAKKTDAERKKVLTPLLAKRDNFKGSHSYPVYERYGYKSFDEFMDGWTWTFKPKDKPADEVHFNARRHEYTVIEPITEPKTGELVLNFYPTTKKGQVIEKLKVDDPRFFKTVSALDLLKRGGSP